MKKLAQKITAAVLTAVMAGTLAFGTVPVLADETPKEDTIETAGEGFATDSVVSTYDAAGAGNEGAAHNQEDIDYDNAVLCEEDDGGAEQWDKEQSRVEETINEESGDMYSTMDTQTMSAEDFKESESAEPMAPETEHTVNPADEDVFTEDDSKENLAGTPQTLADDSTAFAVYSEDDNSLNFAYGTVPVEGGSFNGKNVTNLYTDIGQEAYTSESDVPWHSVSGTVTDVVIDSSFSDADVTDLSYWFYDFADADFMGLENINTEDVTSLRDTFYGCERLESLDGLISWDTGNITTLLGTFEYCPGLKEVNGLTNWDTGKVTTLYNTFRGCSGLTDICGLAAWDTSSVTSLYATFYGCSGLKDIDSLASWNAGNVTTLYDTFSGCSSLADVSGLALWDTGSVSTMMYTFHSCENLTDASALTSWDTSAATGMQSMFYGCSSLTSIDISRWDTTNVTNMQYMFSGCSSLTTIYSDDDVFVTTGITNEAGGTSMFRYCDNLVGGAGTEFNADNTDYEMAHVDSEADPGYFTDAREEEPEAFAVYSDDDASLTFYYKGLPDVGEEYHGKTVTALYTGLDEADYASDSEVPWNDVRETECVVIDDSFAEVQPESLAYWFYGFGSADFTGLENIDVENVTTLRDTFTGCGGLSDTDALAAWDVSAVKDMQDTFSDCAAITDVDGLAAWDTGALTTLKGAFYGCVGLSDIDGLKAWDTTAVTDVSYMFGGCTDLSDADALAKWDMSTVTDMSHIFNDCASLKKLDVSEWDTGNVNDMSYMFQGCNALATIYSDNDVFVTTAVTEGDSMFTDCISLVGGAGTAYDADNVTYTMAHVDTVADPGYFTKLNKEAFAVYSEDDTSLTFYYGAAPEAGATYNDKTATNIYDDVDGINATGTSAIPWYSLRSSIASVVVDESFKAAQPVSLAYWFYNLTKAEFTGLENIDTSKVTTLYNTFYDCYKLNDLSDLSAWDTGNVTTMQNTFYGCSELEDVDGLAAWDTGNVTTLYQTFYSCKKLENVDGLAKWDTGNVTTLHYTFNDCFALTNVKGLAEWDTSAVTELYGTFYECSNLKNIAGLSEWDTGAATTLVYLFYKCPEIENVDALSTWNTSAVTDLRYTFYGCSGLTDVNSLSRWDTSKVTTLQATFWYCSGLTNADVLSGWDTSEVTSLYDTFRDCSNLEEIDVSGWDTAKVTDMRYMFYGCHELTTIYSDDDYFVTSGITSASNGNCMFQNCANLVGSNGTAYSGSSYTYKMAHVDTETNPGYFTDANTTEYDLSLTTDKDSYEVGDTITYTFTITYNISDSKPYGWCYLPSGLIYNGMISATHNGDPYTYYYDKVNNGFEIEDMSEAVSAGDVFVFTYSATADAAGDYTTTANMDGGVSVSTSFTVTESQSEDIVDTILDSSDPLTQGGASDTYYKDGHYYHIDVRIDSDFDYIYNEGVFTIVTDTGINVTKTWQGGVPNGVTSITYYVYRDNGDGTSDKLYYDGYGFLTTEPTREETSGRTTTTVNNDPVTITVKQSDGWSASLDLEAGNYVLVEEEVDGYTSDITYVTVDTSTGEQLNGSYYTYTGNIEVADVNWVLYEMNDNDNADYHYYDDGAFSGYGYGYLDGSHYSAPSDSQQQTTGDWEFFLDDGNANGGRGIKFFTNESTIWVNIDYTVYYVDESGNEVSETFTDQTFEFTPEEWMADNLCTEKDATNTMRGVDLLIEGQKLMENVTTQESSSIISAAATNVKDDGESIFLTGSKSWISADGTYEQDHDNVDEVNILLYRSTEGSDEELLTENADYVVSWSGSIYTIWGSHSDTAGSYEGLPVADENGNEYTYRVDEVPVTGYETVITPVLRDDGFYDNNITNTAAEEVTYGFNLNKEDEDGNHLTGAIFTLKDESGDNVYFLNENGSYAVTESHAAPASIYISAGYTAVTGLTAGTYTLTEVTAPDDHYFTKSDHVFVIDDDGNVTVDGTALSDTNIATITNKAQGTPTPTKYSDHETDFNADTVEYTVDIASIQGVHDLVLHDHLDNGLAIKKAGDGYSVAVTLYPSQADLETGTNGRALTQGSDYAVTEVVSCTYPEETKECTFEIDFSASADLFDTLTKDYVLHITYYCDVDTEGDAYEGDYTDLVNTAHTTYSAHRSADVEADVEIFGFEIDKYTLDENGDETAVSGAVFNLTDAFGTPAYFLSEDDGTYLFEGWGTAPDGYTNDIISGETTRVEGFAGDASSVYTLTEAATPEGYVVSTESHTISINADGEVFLDGERASDGHSAKVFNNPLISVSGTKTWDDAGDCDGIRPDEITFRLFADNVLTSEVTVTKSNGWEYEFTDLPEYKVDSSGTISKVTYTVVEVSVDGYTQVWDAKRVNVTNTHTPETTSVLAEKIWDDNDDEYGNRPDEITLQLYRDGIAVGGSTITLDEANGWRGEITDLIKYHDGGVEYEYTLKEADVGGYVTTTDTSGNAFTFTNTTETVAVAGEKTWNDDNDRDGLRPEEVTVILNANGTEYDTTKATAKDGWAYEFTDLPKYINGVEVTYTITESDVYGYISETNGYDLINTHGIATTAVAGEKAWDDDNNRDGLRPNEITVGLYANDVLIDEKTVTAANGWAYEFTDLPVNENGSEIEYEVKETAVSGYETAYDGYDITNTHVPALTSLSGEKTWADDNDRDGIRPETITVDLYANGDKIDSQTVSEATGWAYEFTDLYKYENGQEIVYEVKEDAIDGYTAAYTDDGITNTHEPGLTSISGKKAWDDTDASLRPDKITVRLFADGDEIDSRVVSKDTGWAYSFDDLYKYRDGGTEIEYTVTEDDVDGYFATYERDTITNHQNPEVSKFVSDPARGESVDERLKEDTADNMDTLEYLIVADHVGSADNVTIHEYMDKELDAKSVNIKSVTLFKNADAEGYAIDYTVTDGPCSAECGLDGCTFEIHIPDEALAGLTSEAYIEIVFDVTADEAAFIDDLTDEIDNHVGLSFGWLGAYATPDETETLSYGIELTKSAFVEGGALKGAKFILSDGERYAELKKTDGTYILIGWTDEKDDAGVITTDENGCAVVEGLHEGEFILTEVKAPDGYRIMNEGTRIGTPSSDAVTIENMPLTSVSGEKTWNDDNDRDGIRPETVTVNLLADGVEIQSTTANADSEWAYAFTDLDKYTAEGDKIDYTVTEAPVEGYETAYDGYDITNTHVPELISVSGTKTWDDENDKDGIRPGSITVRLFVDGKEIGTAMASEDTGWAYEFTGLYKYAGGKEIAYTITEDEVSGYEAAYNGYDITNTHETKTGSDKGKDNGNTTKTGTNSTGSDSSKINSADNTGSTGDTKNTTGGSDTSSKTESTGTVKTGQPAAPIAARVIAALAAAATAGLTVRRKTSK